MALRLIDGCLLIVFISCAILFLQNKRRPSLLRPPGPKPLSVVGNMFDIPREKDYVVYRDWSRKYGSDLIRISTLGTEIVVVNSARSVDALFNKKSAIYSDRPPMTAVSVYMGVNRTMGVLPYGPLWRRMRKAFHAHFYQGAVKAFEPAEMRAARNLLRALLDSPADFRDHVRHMAGEVIIRIAYGIEVKQHSDLYINTAEEAMAWFVRGTQLDGLIFDMFPILQKMPSWVPGAGFKRKAMIAKKVVDDLLEKPWLLTKSMMSEGIAPSSVASMLLEQDDDEISQGVPATMYMAGADTTVGVLSSFFLAMVLYPEVQKKAQAELDLVLNGARLPTLADAPQLPYIDAIIQELLRWHPAGPLGVPHKLTEDDFHDGYFIAAGTTVIANLWAILHDPTIFPDPETFHPERFIGPAHGGILLGDISFQLEDIPFGFGRRACPARHMARASMWIAVASVLAVFDVLPAKDGRGQEIPIEEKYTDGVVSYPAPFPCEIRARSEAARSLIRATEL